MNRKQRRRRGILRPEDPEAWKNPTDDGSSMAVGSRFEMVFPLTEEAHLRAGERFAVVAADGRRLEVEPRAVEVRGDRVVALVEVLPSGSGLPPLTVEDVQDPWLDPERVGGGCYPKK